MIRARFCGLAHIELENMLKEEEFLDAFNSDQTLLSLKQSGYLAQFQGKHS